MSRPHKFFCEECQTSDLDTTLHQCDRLGIILCAKCYMEKYIDQDDPHEFGSMRTVFGQLKVNQNATRLWQSECIMRLPPIMASALNVSRHVGDDKVIHAYFVKEFLYGHLLQVNPSCVEECYGSFVFLQTDRTHPWCDGDMLAATTNILNTVNIVLATA